MITRQNTKPFVFRDLALMGVLSALATMVSVASAMVIHATGLIAVPGLSGFLVSLTTSVVIYVVLRKIPRFGALTIMAAVNALVVMLAMGKPWSAVAVLMGGLAGDAYMAATSGHRGRWSPIVALVIYRGVREVTGLVMPMLIGVTQSRVAFYIMLISILGGICGAFVGGLSGRSLMDRLAKSGVVR